MFATPSQELVTDLLRRVLEDRERGVQPHAYWVPASKADFPKVLCLDLNKWINLGRAYHGLPGGEHFKHALAAVQTAVEAGTLVVPVAAENTVEAQNRRDASSRRRLAEFMVALSRNHSLLHSVAVETAELDRAVGAVYCGETTERPLRPRLVQRGLGAAMAGGTPRLTCGDAVMDDLLNEVVSRPELAVELLAQPTGQADLKEYRLGNAAVTTFLEEVRRAVPTLAVQERGANELRNVFTQGSTVARLSASLARRGLEPMAFWKWLHESDRVVGFAAAAPSIHVLGTLMLHKDRNLQEPIDDNDGEDLFFLRVAVPYANAVVTERRWAHFANSTKLANHYGTTVLADAADLPRLLHDLGCI